MNTRCIIMIIVLTAATSATAQITLTEEIFLNRYTIGNTYTIDSGIINGPLNVGTASSTAQTFDFSAVAMKNAPKTFTFYAASTTSHASLFPGATLCLELPLTIGAAYFYRAIVHDTGVEDFGYYVLGVKLINSPPDVIEKLPSTYGTTWTYYSDTVTTAPTAGTTVKTFSVKVRTMDAFGTILAGGTSYQCLRQKIVSVASTDTIISGVTTQSNVKTVSLYYVTQDGSFFSLNIDTTDENATSLTPTGIFFLQGHTTAVKESDGLPDGLSLAALYPNPLRDNATMEYTLSEYAKVRVEIVDMLGRTLGTIINSPQSAGRYGVALNAATLPAGEYNCRVSVNGNISNHFMHVVK